MSEIFTTVAHSSSSAFGYNYLYSQTVMFCKIGLCCAPKLGLEDRWLWPKVMSSCHDGAGLQNT
jgi:hypothetical protein